MCPKYDECSASLCPLSARQELAELRGFWVEEDEICSLQGQQLHPLVVKQKQLRKAGARGLFTLAMIESLKRIPAGIQGLPLEACYGVGLDRKAREWIKARNLVCERVA